MVDAPWPPSFDRVPDEEWVHADVADLALKYDTLEQHGWYANLDPTVSEVAAHVEDGTVLVDYSGGTGILLGRLLDTVGDTRVGFVNVDSSPKFLRLSLEKFRDEPRVAFRRIHYLKEEGRLEFLDEVLGSLNGSVDILTSTNAVHLYYDLPDTLRAWWRALRPDGRVFVQSGNIRREGLPADRWIIDESVHALHDQASRIVREDEAYARYRPVLDDPERLAAYDALRNKYFLPVRPLGHYVDLLEEAGFRDVEVTHRPVTARVEEWMEFLSVYHEGILGWVGGVERIEGRPASPEEVEERLALLGAAADRVFAGKATFDAEWTYITARRPGP